MNKDSGTFARGWFIYSDKSIICYERHILKQQKRSLIVTVKNCGQCVGFGQYFVKIISNFYTVGKNLSSTKTKVCRKQ